MSWKHSKTPFGRIFRPQNFAVQTLAIALASCVCLGQTHAQIELKADSNHVETGNPYVLHLRIPANMGKPDTLRFFAWENLLPAQNIVNQSGWQQEGGFLTQNLTALFFDEDTIELAPLPIAFSNGDTLATNPLQIIVTATPAPEDLNDMAPIKDIHREPTYWTDYWPWLLGALAVLGILGLMYWIANRKSKTKMQSRNVQIPAHELALKKLEILARKHMISNGLVKEHYAELTFILREYLEKRFGIPALESTTEETLHHLKNKDFDPQLAQALQNVLEQSDLAKFAKIIPPESFHISAMETAQNIVHQTSAPIENATDQ